MAIGMIKTKYVGESIFSPFTGEAIDGPDGPNESDPSLLFIYYGNAGEYAYISEATQENLESKGIVDAEELEPDDLIANLDIEAAFSLEVDTGWNGINYYGFVSNQQQ